MDYKIVSIRKNPEYLDDGVRYFSSKWGSPEDAYRDKISSCINTPDPLPRWYLMIREDGEIVGGFGLTENDSVQRQDLKPYLCALFVEPGERGQALGARMLMYGQAEAEKLGFKNLYLVTDHIGYYEKYGWDFAGMIENEGGEGEARLYQIRTDD